MRRPPRLVSFAILSFALAAACGSDGDGLVIPTVFAFAPIEVTTLGTNTARDLAIVDADRDGLPDVVVADESGNVLLLRSLPAGGLIAAVPTPFAAVDRAAVVAAGDLDGDRAPDLAVASADGGSIAVLRNLGSGSFGVPVLAPPLPVPARDLAIADVDGDGRGDVVAASATTAELFVLRGDGLGALAVPVRLALAGTPGDLLLADVNGDGSRDLVTPVPQRQHVAVLLFAGNGAFAPPLTTSLPAPSVRLGAADLDGDGAVDLVVLGSRGDRAELLRGDGTGRFARLGATLVPGGTNELALADADGDGVADLLALSPAGVTVARGDGTGRFLRADRSTSATVPVTALRTADLDGDGRVDAAFLFGTAALGVLRNPRELPAGVAQFGRGTPDCLGTIAMRATSSPVLGNEDLVLLAQNAPPNAVGLLLLGGPADPTGTDAFGLGFLMHLVPGDGLSGRTVGSDAVGAMATREPIPATPALAGLVVNAQTLWFARAGESCSASTVRVASSRGLALTVAE